MSSDDIYIEMGRYLSVEVKARLCPKYVSDVDDVVQESLNHARQALTRMEQRGEPVLNLKALCRTIASRTSLTWLRAKTREACVQLHEIPEPPATDVEPDEKLMALEKAKFVEDLIRTQFSDIEQTIIKHMFEEGGLLKVEKLTGISRATVYRHRQRILERLKTCGSIYTQLNKVINNEE